LSTIFCYFSEQSVFLSSLSKQSFWAVFLGSLSERLSWSVVVWAFFLGSLPHMLHSTHLRRCVCGALPAALGCLQGAHGAPACLRHVSWPTTRRRHYRLLPPVLMGRKSAKIAFKKGKLAWPAVLCYCLNVSCAIAYSQELVLLEYVTSAGVHKSLCC